MRIFLYLILVGVLTTACNNEVSSSFQAKPIALGKMNEVVIVCDDELWEGPIGDTLQYYFGSPYPLMPVPEPMFDLRHFSGEEINAEELRCRLRTYVIVADLSDEESTTTKMVRKDIGEEKFRQAMTGSGQGNSVGRNKWANGQVLFYLFGDGIDNLSSLINKSYPAVAEGIHKHDSKQLKAKTYPRGVNLGISEDLSQSYGIKIKIPAEYVIAKSVEDQELFWFRKDDKKGTQNLVIQKIKYQSKDQFGTQTIIDACDAFGKSYVVSDTKGSYLRINDKVLPVLEYNYDIDGLFTKELRGIWEMTDDFLGGPFVAYLMQSKKEDELVLIFNFVLAVGYDKKEMVQQLDYIVRSIEST